MRSECEMFAGVENAFVVAHLEDVFLWVGKWKAWSGWFWMVGTVLFVGVGDFDVGTWVEGKGEGKVDIDNALFCGFYFACIVSIVVFGLCWFFRAFARAFFVLLAGCSSGL